MNFLCVVMLSIIAFVAGGKIMFIKNTEYNVYLGRQVAEENEPEMDTLPGLSMLLGEGNTANKFYRPWYLKKCVMSYCVAMCRKMGYHRGVCVQNDNCECYN